MVCSNQYKPQVWSLETHSDWQRWLDKQIDCYDRGLVLILARHAAEQSVSYEGSLPMSIADWLAHIQSETAPNHRMRRANTLAQLCEKQSVSMESSSPAPRRGSPKDLPFSRKTFECISKKLQIHDSIVRAVSRTDIPTFNCEKVEMMERGAFVYSCRTPNSWESDLALSATLVLRKLQTIKGEVAHPLVIPGLLTELELSRHTRLVESSITDVETKILNLNVQAETLSRFQPAEIERRNHAKRGAWLDLTYLRNSLITWTGQLKKMIDHAKALESSCFLESLKTVNTGLPRQLEDMSSRCNDLEPLDSYAALMEDDQRKDTGTKIPTHSIGYSETQCHHNRGRSDIDRHESIYSSTYSLADAETVYVPQMRTVGAKITSRLISICDEYDEKIRDCTMRVDGMAMATQWSHSETAVDISLATSRDSRVMRSISLVTMVFLPGTFFATVFSMTFFDWHDQNGGTRVSSYLWVYIVVTVFFTAITIGLWYFFVIFRRTGRKTGDEENEVL
ncbi:hypothetical protein EKO04_001039 [Ascochyta lentis]|uniref:Uncharacterized protein n=1 Tax=Ascochyta lentis TaxID=205686 RepID=A0A8H7MLG7_9PLEO|nr:hypothetical protein EKO04_001039 [Ascochyta lentis]